MNRRATVATAPIAKRSAVPRTAVDRSRSYRDVGATMTTPYQGREMLWRTGTLLGIAVTAAVSGVVAAAPVQARDCIWQLQPTVILIQDNDLRVELATAGNRMAGSARYAHLNGQDWTSGTATGGLDPDAQTVTVSVQWIHGPGAGLSNSYSGTMDNNGVLTGTTTNSLGTVNSWKAMYGALCKEPAPTDLPVTPAGPLQQDNTPSAPLPTTAAPAPSTSRTATITDDVDVYAQPGGVGSPSRMLPRGTSVTVVQRRSDNWVQLLDVGWVWGDFVSIE